MPTRRQASPTRPPIRRRSLWTKEWLNMAVRNNARAIKTICRGTAWLTMLLALGCAPAARRAVKAAPPPPPTVVPPAGFVDVQRDAGGVSFTEHVPVTEEVRADYDAAVHMLE